jgi:Spy/CpxP family protein refolding chaperone
MKKKAVLIALLGMCFVFSRSATADPMDGHSMNKHESRGHEMTGGKGSQCPVADKLMRKAHFLLEHETDLALTDEQVKTIKGLELEAEKDSIRQAGDMKIFLLDLKSKLGEDKIDAEGTKAFIDKTFSSVAEAAKANVDAYAKLQGVLTPDQLAKMKALVKEKKEHWRNAEK